MTHIAAAKSWNNAKSQLEQLKCLCDAALSSRPENGTTEPVQDYVNAVVFNQAGEALVVQKKCVTRGWSRWQVLTERLSPADDPILVAKNRLLQVTGFSTEVWRYIGSYTSHPDQLIGAGHYFVARAAAKVAEPTITDPNNYLINWVPVQELRYALLDGRIISITYAISVSLALLTIEK